MKYLLTLLSLIALSFSTLHAQDQNQRLKALLNLSQEQVAQIEQAGNEMSVTAKSIMQSEHLTQAEKQTQLNALQEQMKLKMQSLLTPEQKAKLAAEFQK